MKKLLFIYAIAFCSLYVSSNAQNPDKQLRTERFGFGGSLMILSDKQSDYNFVGLSIKSVDTSNRFIAVNLFYPVTENSKYKYVFESNVGKYGQGGSLFTKNSLKARPRVSINPTIIIPNDDSIKNKSYVVYGIGASLGLEFSYKFIIVDMSIGPNWDTENNLYTRFNTSLSITFDGDWVR